MEYIDWSNGAIIIVKKLDDRRITALLGMINFNLRQQEKFSFFKTRFSYFFSFELRHAHMVKTYPSIGQHAAYDNPAVVFWIPGCFERC